MAQNAGLFIQQEDVFVLVDDVQPGRADLEVRVFLARFFKKLVVDIELDGIARVQPRVAFGALAVELDALEADVFLQQRFRQKRHGFAHKTVETLARVVVPDGKLLHFNKKSPSNPQFFCIILYKNSVDKS